MRAGQSTAGQWAMRTETPGGKICKWCEVEAVSVDADAGALCGRLRGDGDSGLRSDEPMRVAVAGPRGSCIRQNTAGMADV